MQLSLIENIVTLIRVGIYTCTHFQAGIYNLLCYIHAYDLKLDKSRTSKCLLYLPIYMHRRQYHVLTSMIHVY